MTIRTMLARLVVLCALVVACVDPTATHLPAPVPSGCGPATPQTTHINNCATHEAETPRPKPSPTPSRPAASQELQSPGCSALVEVGRATACSTEPPTVELPNPGAKLDPGRYSHGGFEPLITFRVSDRTWTTQQQASGFFDIEDEPGSLDVVAVQFANVVGLETAAAAAADIAARDNLSVTEAVPIAIDGITGLQIVVETTDPADADPPVFRQVMTVPPGPVSIASGRRLEVTLLDMDGEVLAVLVGGSIAEWERAIELSRPVLDSLTIAY